jgi:hypothetical protein
MILIEKLVLENSGYVIPGMEIPPISTIYNIEKLISELNSNGIEIDSKKSHKLAHCFLSLDDIKAPMIFSENKISGEMFPFIFDFPLDFDPKEPLEIEKYFLKNNELDLEIKAYNYIEDNSDFPDRLLVPIGGPIKRKYGILCDIIFNGDYEKGKIISDAKKILDDFYRPIIFPKRGRFI